MNDVRRVLDDDALLDRLARGERPVDAGPAEDLLLALRADARVADALLPAPDADLVAAPAAVPRVVRVRGALAGSLVAAAVLAGTSGVAAAVTGDPLAGLSGVRDAVSVAAAPDGRTPLLRSREGARLHQEVLRVADLIAAGQVEDARDALAAMPSALSGLTDSEQRLLRDELAITAPDLVEAAGLVEDPTGPGRAPGRPSGPATQDPGVDGDDGAGTPTDPALPTQTGKPSKTTKPPKTTRPPRSTSPTLPTSPPVTPTVTPPPVTEPSVTTSAAPPSASAAPTAPPTTSAEPGPRQGGDKPEPGKPSKPPRTKGAADEVAPPGLDLAVRLPLEAALLLIAETVVETVAETVAESVAETVAESVAETVGGAAGEPSGPLPPPG